MRTKCHHERNSINYRAIIRRDEDAHLIVVTSWKHHPVTLYRPAFWRAIPANNMPNRGGRPATLLIIHPANAPVTYSMNMEARLPVGTTINSGVTFTYSTLHAMTTATNAAVTLAAVAGNLASHHSMPVASSAAPSCRCTTSCCPPDDNMAAPSSHCVR